jgi:hypothetical protein
MCSSSRRSTGQNAQLSSHGSTRLATTYSSASARGTSPSGSWFAMQPISRISISLQSDIVTCYPSRMVRQFTLTSQRKKQAHRRTRHGAYGHPRLYFSGLARSPAKQQSVSLGRVINGG